MRQYATEHASESVMEKADFVNKQVLGRVNGKYKREYMPGAALFEIAKEEADN